MSGEFLTAEWHYLAMLSYEIQPAVLTRYLPAGTELDSWNGKALLTVVGLLFRRAKILGFPVPFHRNFEGVNLRFYVRRRTEDGWRKGVAFVKQIVPRRTLAAVARLAYGANCVSLPMRHQIETEGGRLKHEGSVEYGWLHQGRWAHLGVKTAGGPQRMTLGSPEEFVAERYWGYARQRGGATREYRVEHPAWRVWQSSRASLDCDAASLYGREFVDSLSSSPLLAFLAEGSPVVVRKGSRI